MRRLTTDDPQDNVQTIQNLFYKKDGWPWVRGVVEVRDTKDEPLHEIIRRCYTKQCQNPDLLREDDDPFVMIFKILLNEPVEKAWMYATMFTAAIAACDMRERLKAIEDILGEDYDLEKLKKLVEAGRDEILHGGGEPEPQRYGQEEEQREKLSDLGG